MITISTERGFTIAARAELVEPGTTMKAWAERHVRVDPDLRWILGNFVEANEANSNGHIFPLEDLHAAQHTIAGKPLNMLHRDHYIVGCFAGAQLVTAEGAEINEGETTYAMAAADVGQHPYVEAVAGMWHTRFPEEFFDIKRAHSDGSLYFSMEAIPEEVSCPKCGLKAEFAGLESDTYCDDMQGPVGPKVLHKPTFNGGAIIIPPVKPGWKRADVRTISNYIGESEVERAYAGLIADASHLDAAHAWETLMEIVAAQAPGPKEYSPAKRDKMAKKGTALPDGGFPIESRADVQRAIRAIGRAKNPAAAKAHIKARAKALGCTDLIPPNW